MGSPPHTRGIHPGADVGRHQFGITPAYAGNTQMLHSNVQECWDHPRIRGEYFILRLNSLYIEGSPPHTRGIHLRQQAVYLGHGITPAYAGNTYSRRSSPRPAWDHPRIRGEYTKNFKRVSMLNYITMSATIDRN